MKYYGLKPSLSKFLEVKKETTTEKDNHDDFTRRGGLAYTPGEGPAFLTWVPIAREGSEHLFARTPPHEPSSAGPITQAQCELHPRRGRRHTPTRVGSILPCGTHLASLSVPDVNRGGWARHKGDAGRVSLGQWPRRPGGGPGPRQAGWPSPQTAWGDCFKAQRRPFFWPSCWCQAMQKPPATRRTASR